MTRIIFCSIIAVALFFLNTTDINGQEATLRHYSKGDGIPSNCIYNLYKDHDGFLWLCSDKGISRYNGIKFETFTTFDGLPGNEVFFFAEDNQQRLWLATFNGELCFYKNGKFQTALNTPFLRLPFKRAFLDNILVNNDSSITIGFHDCTKWVTLSEKQYTIHHFDTLIPNFCTNFIYLNKISGNKYEIIFNDQKVVADTNGAILRRKKFDKIYRLSKSPPEYYMYTEDSIYTIQGQSLAEINHEVFNKKKLYHIHFIKENIFYCTDKGLYINNNIHLLKDHKVSGIVQDKSGNYWIATLNDGLYNMSKDFLTVKSYKDCYKGIAKFAKAEDDYLFFTTDNNNLYRCKEGASTCLLDYKKYNSSNKPLKGQASLITSNTYYGIFNENIFRINNIRGIPGIDILRISNIDNASAYKDVFLKQNALYGRRFRTVDRIVLSDSKYKKNGKNILSASIKWEYTKTRVFGMAEDMEKEFWFSTIDTVYKIVNETPIPQPQFNTLSFKWFDIIGNYLIGCTHNNQLAVCNNISGKLQYDIIQNENCTWDKLYRLDTNRVIISTNNLYRVLTLSPSGGKPAYNVLTIENPFIPTEAEYICSNGKNCFFLKDGSITSIDIKTLLKKALPPDLKFQFLKHGKQVDTIKSEMEIPYEMARNISISLSAISFGGKDIQYQYSVSKSENDNWVNLTGDINLLHPGYGDYVIKARAKTISSDYSVPKVFTLHVLRPFWASWWFIMACICLLAIIIVTIVRYRMSVALRKKQETHEKEIRFMKSEFKALNALMNPHFIFNTLNNVQDLINKNDKRAANEYLRYFADLVRQNMHNVSKELISLQKEIELVNNYLLLEKLRFEDFLNYKIEIDDELDLSEIMVPPLLIQPLVENSIKHGIRPLESVNAQIHIIIYEKHDIVYIEVRDNGMGIQAAQHTQTTSHESFGLENIRQRVKQLSIIQNKEILLRTGIVQEDQQQWTIVTVSIPVSDSLIAD